MSKPSFDIKSLPEKGAQVLQTLGKYKVLIFILMIVGVYGFVLWRIQALSTTQPSSSAISAQINPVANAHIDQSVVNQLKQLQDNNVSVQSLFEQARNNPFQG